jgi:hypothetical protein
MIETVAVCVCVLCCTVELERREEGNVSGDIIYPLPSNSDHPSNRR